MLQTGNGHYTYKWKHIPTGISGERTIICNNVIEFYEKINKWNLIGDSTWKYWV